MFCQLLASLRRKHGRASFPAWTFCRQRSSIFALFSLYCSCCHFTRTNVGTINTGISMTGSMIWAIVSGEPTYFLMMRSFDDIRVAERRISTCLCWAVTILSTHLVTTSSKWNGIPAVLSVQGSDYLLETQLVLPRNSPVVPRRPRHRQPHGMHLYDPVSCSSMMYLVLEPGMHRGWLLGFPSKVDSFEEGNNEGLQFQNPITARGSSCPTTWLYWGCFKRLLRV